MFGGVTLETLEQWCSARFINAPNTQIPVTNISTDSRTLVPGDVFVALRGPAFDGNLFTADAIQKGALAVIGESAPPKKTAFLPVANSLGALVAIGEGQRGLFRGPVVGITGSSGKSSTKEMTATLVGAGALASPASFNNLIGVSKTLCLATDATESIILELGMNARTEIAELCRRFRPQRGAITNIGDAHLGKLGSKEAIYQAKKELFDFLAHNDCQGVALNVSDPLIARALEESGLSKSCNRVSYSKDARVQASILLLRAQLNPQTAFLDMELSLEGVPIQCTLPIFGMHHTDNLLTAICLARLCNTSLDSIIKRLPLLRPAAHRGQVISMAQERTLIDECYNSNPSALISSLQSLMQIDSKRRLVVVLGEMRELGEFSAAQHLQVGNLLGEWLSKRESPSVIIGVGESAQGFLAAAKNTPKIRTHHIPAVEDAYALVEGVFQPGDLLFVKGSRGVQLDRLVLHFASEKSA